jgi:hypothetical protein
MTRVIVDAELLKKLHNLTEPLELADESGCVLAKVLPAAFDPSEWERWEPEWDEEELRRREQSEEWYTTAEVLRHLENLK